MGDKTARTGFWTRRSVRWTLTIILIVLLVGFRLVERIGEDKKPSDRFIVVKVIDGDSVELQGRDRLRLLTVDTPEKGEPLFDEARQFLADLALGKIARIEFAGKRRDKYGRLLGYLYIDSLFVNKAILEHGLGYLYLFKDTDIGQPETKILMNAQRRAMAAGVGLWAIERAAEDQYISTAGSFRFHRPGCRYVERMKLDRVSRFAYRNDALYEGLSPCRTCRP